MKQEKRDLMRMKIPFMRGRIPSMHIPILMEPGFVFTSGMSKGMIFIPMRLLLK